MPPFQNLISNSLLINETIELLESFGGRTTAVKIVDYVMKISQPEPGFARLLVQDLIDRDPRLAFVDDMVEFVGTDHGRIALEEAGYVVFDLETTGAKAPPCRITEIGACRVRGGEVVDTFTTLVNPETPIPPFISALTGISDQMVSNAPRFREVIGGFLDFVGDSVLVAHNARFDMGFLNHEIGRVFEDYRIANPSLCTVQLARKLLPQIANHKLKTVAEHFSVELIHHHRAGDDANATARIFIILLKDLCTRGVRDLAAAHRFASRSKYVRRQGAAT